MAEGGAPTAAGLDRREAGMSKLARQVTSAPSIDSSGVKTRTTCRVCEARLDQILSLGEQYVSNFVDPNEPDGLKAELELVLCSECRLLQLRETVPPEALYRNYWYRSGTNESMRRALAEIATETAYLGHLADGDAVLDTGSNDGTLLASYPTQGLYKIGFDPSENLAAYSQQIADKVVVDFFSAKRYFETPELRDRRPKAVTSIAMFYDLEDPNQFVEDIKAVMHDDGVWVVQMSYLPLMLKQNAFDNICHEHLEYYSLRSFESLLARHDFEVVDMQLNDVNGGSFRVHVRNRGAGEDAFGDATYRALAHERVEEFRRREEEARLDHLETYQEFASRVDRVRDDVVGFIQQQVSAGRSVYVYGASTKGNTLLQYFGLDRTMIKAAAERSPVKWGKVTVGTRIPIVSEEEARAAKPDHFLVLPWHFLEEFEERERSYLRSGGRFIVPLPHFMLL
jgi:NDP-4-keto-2,6-dideoxyhexose 3-C-methyltransferase